MRLLVPLMALLLSGCSLIGAGPTPTLDPTSPPPQVTPTPIVIIITPAPTSAPTPTPEPTTAPTTAHTTAPTSEPTPEPTVNTPTPAELQLACTAVDLADVRIILSSDQIIGPEWRSLANGAAQECRWYNGTQKRVLSVVVFANQADYPDWGSGQAGLDAHNDLVGLNWRDYMSSAGDCYWYRGVRSGSWGVADAVVMTPRDECSAERIGGNVTSVVEALDN